MGQVGHRAGLVGGFAALLAALVVFAALASGAEQERPPAYVYPPPAGAVAVDGTITELSNFGNRVFVRGAFQQIGEFNGSSLGLDPATGERIGGVPVTDGQVSDVIPDGDGGWYIAGSFSYVGGQPQGLVARVSADGTLDASFAPDLEGNDADALALVGDTLFVGGQLHWEGDRNLLALDADTGATAHSVRPIDGRVTELAYAPAGPGHSRRLIVGVGSGRSTPPAVLAIDPATGLDLAGFTPPAGGIVRALAVDGNTLYVGGRGLVALDLGTGAPIPSFDPASYDIFGPEPYGGIVHSLLVDGDRLLAGGNFNHLGGEPGPLASLDPATGKADPGFDSPLSARYAGEGRDSGVFDLALTPGHLWAGGSFAGPGFSRRPRALLALDPDTGKTLGAESVRLNAQVNALSASGDRMYVGGWFFLVDPHYADGLASLDAKTLAVTDEVTRRPPHLRYRYDKVMLPGQDRLLFADTNFHGYRKPPLTPWAPSASRVAAIDTSTGKYLRRYGIGRIRNMTGIAVGGNHVYVAQRLGNDARFPRNRISVRSLRTGKETGSFQLPLRGYVTKLGFGGGSLFAGGSFRRFRADGTPAHLAVIRVDPRTGSLRGRFDPHVNGPVYDIEVDNGRVYSVGLFTKAGPKIPPRGSGDGRVPLERRGLDAADVADGSAIKAFEPRGNWHSDLYRLRAVAGCLDASNPFSYFSPSSLLSQETGLPCRGDGLPLYPGETTAAVGKIAFTGSGYSFEQNTLEFVTLVPSP